MKPFSENKLYEVEGANKRRASVIFQYTGCLSASIMAFCSGCILGWSSPAEPRLLHGGMGFNVTTIESSWVGSLLPIGAAISCVPAGYLTDYVGRKYTLIGIVPVFLLGLGLIIWATSIGMLYAGRFIGGMCSGAISVAAPVYIAEICEKDIRGAMGSFYQLNIAGGIMFVYVVGSLVNVFWLTIICAIFPCVFIFVFLFFPETPVFHIAKGRTEDAKKSLRFFRGQHYELEPEFTELVNGVKVLETHDQTMTTLQVFKSKQGTKSMYFSIGMMVFQQLSGINAIIFYTTTIFKEAGSTLAPEIATIIIGVMEVSSTFLMFFAVDRFGRRILQIVSSSVMAVSLLVVGLFFYFKTRNYDVSSVGWIPLVALCIYIIVFSIGTGPIPWGMMAEILPTQIKGLGSSIASVINWLCAFLVTKFFAQMVSSLGADVTYWIFVVINILGTVFNFYLIETKGKSFEQIQKELGGDKN